MKKIVLIWSNKSLLQHFRDQETCLSKQRSHQNVKSLGNEHCSKIFFSFYNWINILEYIYIHIYMYVCISSPFHLLFFIFATSFSMSRETEKPKLNLNTQTQLSCRYKHTYRKKPFYSPF